MLQWYPNHFRIGAAPVVTMAMVVVAIIGRMVLPGASFFMWPLFASLPLVLALHIYLLVDDNTMSRLDALFYALVHLPLAFVIWTFSVIYANGGNLL
ncbi:hypothetical protein [Ferrimonas marina]|uniref:Uncharacterized protein n=1 Tax=Ferrimonas marina TaxID=299255 RepID=A0A1M5ZFH1_9GAMM|nr:hypothetical protein [Ferrimonas marina]SHI23000.1 hypothetical protein SAMN02745129_0231 [Ferrimonas marina]